jgi:signal transduction histidine kinase
MIRRAGRSFAYLLTGIPVGIAALFALLVLVVAGLATSVILAGVVLLAGAVLLGIPFSALERRRLRIVGRPVPGPRRRPWLLPRLTDPATWRDLGSTVLLATVLWPLDTVVVGLVAIPIGLLITPVLQGLYGEIKVLKLVLVTDQPSAWLAAALGVPVLVAVAALIALYGDARARLARLALSTRDTVLDLTRSRARLVDAFDAERSRIERDLHDGAQQRLVALGMTLGLARLADPAEVPGLVDKAYDQANAALGELRDLIRAIHPQILTDRGLPAAVRELADRSPVPVSVTLALDERPPAPVERAAYFAVSEALANAAKHSGCTTVLVHGARSGEALAIEVRDDGHGGADPSNGTGLTGLADRIAVVGGTLTLDSPAGGPTCVRLEFPWP